MKHFMTAVAALLLFNLGLSAQATKKENNIETITIKTSAVCDMCKETLEKAMAYERGVKTSSLDVATKVLTVTFDSKKTTPEKIRMAVTKAGYDADDMKADARAYDNLNACCKKDAKH
jgi:copper chaperone CopZ